MNDRYFFRGKRLDGGGWVRGHYRSRTMEPDFDRIRHFISMDYPEIYEIDPATIGQCTGLKDKNGRLIFEGDVLKKNDKFNSVWIVKWAEGANFSIYPPSVWGGRQIFYHDSDVLNFEIIGNVHDNPGHLS